MNREQYDKPTRECMPLGPVVSKSAGPAPGSGPGLRSSGDLAVETGVVGLAGALGAGVALGRSDGARAEAGEQGHDGAQRLSVGDRADRRADGARLHRALDAAEGEDAVVVETRRVRGGVS